MLRTPIFLAIFLIACSPLPAATPSDLILESIKKDFVQHITTGKSDFKVSEVIDKKDDKKAFLQKSLPSLYMPGKEKVSYKEIFVRFGKLPGHFHLGIIQLVYANEQLAQAAFKKITSSNKGRYFSNTKILTKYALKLKSNTMLVLYSETFIEPTMKSFLAKPLPD